MDHPINQPVSSTPAKTSLSRLKNLTLSTDILVLLGLLFIVVVLWIPFGLKVGFVQDGWEYFAQVDRNEVFVWAARPLHHLVWVVTLGITPGSFISSNIVLALCIFGKGWLSYLILKQLRCPSAFAFAGAALITHYGADTGIFYLGGLPAHVPLFCYLLALYLLILYWKRRRFLYIVGMTLAQIICLFVYEAAYPLILFSLLLLLLVSRRGVKQFILTTVLWYEIPALIVLRLALLTLSQPGDTQYQTGLLSGRGTFGEIIPSLITVYQRHFIGVWQPGVITPMFVLLAVLSGFSVFAICTILQKSQPGGLLPEKRYYGGFIIGGITVVALGVGVFLLTPLRNENSVPTTFHL